MPLRLASLIAFLVTTAASGMNGVPFARHPYPSPDGTKIAFSYAGDIWTCLLEGGAALRLTTNPAYEYHPVWSPDGNWIAFTANRDGDDDVWIIPSGGGASKRLTYLDQREEAFSWTPDSKEVIFCSRRQASYPDYQQPYRVSIDGGEPTRITDAYGTEASLSPDGNALMLSRYDPQWWRRGYRSSGAAQVWKLDLRTSNWQQVTLTPLPIPPSGNDYLNPTERWPIWVGGKPVIASEADSTMNLWMRSDDGRWIQLTRFRGDGVRFPAASRTGQVIVFEQGLDIYRMIPSGEPVKIEIDLTLDPSDIEPQDVSFSDRADRLAFNPDGKEMFLSVRGETIAGRIVGDDDKAARGRASDLSQSSPGRESDLAVSPGGDTLMVVSDRTGNKELFQVTSADTSTRELARTLHPQWKQVTFTSQDETSPTFSPDGKSLAFRRGNGDLVIRDVATGSERNLLTGWSLQTFAWSPDSKWIAFAREDDDYNSDIFIIPVAGGREVNISRHPDDDDSPVWSADGRKLGFRSKRRENNWDIFFVWLKLADEQKSPADFAEEVRNKDQAKKEKKAEKEKEKKSDKDKKGVKKKGSKEEPADTTTRVEVVIDTTDIYQRVRAVTNLAGEEGIFTISPDGEQFVFTGNHEGDRDLYKIKWNGEGMKRLTTGSANPKQVEYDPTGKRIRYLDGSGRVKSIDADGGSSKDHPFDARLSIDRRAERQQKFLEVWRGINDRFYDPNFHGQNWTALRDKYQPYAEAASCENDFGDVVNMMLGELNSSHMGYNSPPTGSKSSGRIGIDYRKLDDGSAYEVTHVIKDSPADRIASKLQLGDRIKEVSGKPITASLSLEKLLDDQVSQRVELVIDRKGTSQRIIIKPIPSGDLGDLRYEEWVEARRKLVDSLSNGTIGYLHIKGMSDESLARFEAELYSVGAGKKALVVDVRYNGGGWTTDWMLAMLQVKRHAVTYPRGGGPGYPQSRLPLYSWVKPVVALCNEHSFSNAEIFSHSIQTLKRGMLYGVPTPGGVISTDGDGLLDGSFYRIPLRGWYIGDNPSKDPARNMEGHGAIPDKIIPLLPNQTGATADQQLITAVRDLMATR